MRRLLRWLINGLCLLSLLACVATGWLWWHSYRGDGDRIAVRLRGQRYVLRSQSGEAVVVGLGLRRPDPTREKNLRDLLGRFHNSDLVWITELSRVNSAYDRAMHRKPDSTIPQEEPILPFDEMHLSAADARPLLEALDDPDRFAVAHLVLTLFVFGRVPGFDLPPGYSWHDNGLTVNPQRRIVEGRYQGLRIRFPESGKGWVYGRDPMHYLAQRVGRRRGAGGSEGGPPTAPTPPPGGDGDVFEWYLARPERALRYEGAAAGYDPTQATALRETWFNYLAVPVLSQRLWPAPAAAAVLPLLWLASRARRSLVRRRRRRLGKCLRCGYDLTGNTSGRCSECGQGVEPVTAADSAPDSARQRPQRDVQRAGE